jgi:hypothetical protein
MHEAAAEEISRDITVAAEPLEQRRNRLKLVKEPREMVLEVVVRPRRRAL